MSTPTKLTSPEPKNRPRARGPSGGVVVFAYAFCLILLGLLVLLLQWTIWLWAAAVVVFLAVGLGVARRGRRYLVPAFAIQGGLMVWFAASALVQPLAGVPMALVWGEIAVLAVALVALMAVNHAWPAVVLAFYEMFGLFLNLYQMGIFSPTVVLNPLQGKESIAGIALVRLVAILLLMVGVAQAEAARAAARPAGPAQREVSAEAADDLRRLAALASDGIISQEEFEAKKRRILGL